MNPHGIHRLIIQCVIVYVDMVESSFKIQIYFCKKKKKKLTFVSFIPDARTVYSPG